MLKYQTTGESAGHLQFDLFELHTEAFDAETAGLARLASAVLEKSPADLAAITEFDPGICRLWLNAFERHRAVAEEEAQFWTAAKVHLLTAAQIADGNSNN